MIINNDFIRQHDRLVRVIVNQFKVANVDPEDLMQEGRIGLIEAAKRFDPSRGIQFASYASWWIRKYINMAILQYNNVVAIPQRTPELATQKRRSMDAIVDVEDGDCITYQETITDGTYAEQLIIEQEEKTEWHERLQKAISHLSQREQQIIEALYGLKSQPLTTEELAIQMGTSPNRIRRVHERAIHKIRGYLKN